jgi:hypothetical protein
MNHAAPVRLGGALAQPEQSGRHGAQRYERAVECTEKEVHGMRALLRHLERTPRRGTCISSRTRYVRVGSSKTEKSRMQWG